MDKAKKKTLFGRHVDEIKPNMKALHYIIYISLGVNINSRRRNGIRVVTFLTEIISPNSLFGIENQNENQKYFKTIITKR